MHYDNGVYCQCANSSSVGSDMDDFGCWSVCVDCNMPVEDTYQYFNHYDGEDHMLSEGDLR